MSVRTGMADEMPDSRNTGGSEDDSGTHAEAIRRAQDAWSAEVDNISQGREDQRFYAGEQWPDNAKLARDQEGRPVLTVNRLPSFARQVTGSLRKDPPAIRVLPAKDSTEEHAEIYTGLIRSIEQKSNAKAAYIQGIDNALQTGNGAWCVLTRHEDDDSFDQEIYIKRIIDPFGVLFDPMAQEPDKKDGQFAFVFSDISVEEFRRQWPKARLEGFPTPPAQGALVWKTEHSIRIAQYWRKEPTTKTIVQYEDGTVEELGAKEEEQNADEGAPQPKPIGDPIPEVTQAGPPEATDEQPESHGKVVNKRTVKTHKIVSRLMTGAEFLKPDEEWAGKYIPVVPVVGEEIRMDGRTVRKGMVRDARDVQQALNYAVTAQVEAAGMAPKAPIAVTAKQIQGYEGLWQTAGYKNNAYLIYNADPEAPGQPQRIAPIPTQPGLSELVMQSSGHMKEITGLFDASLGAPSNEQSGKAILARQNEGDTASYYLVDNLATAIRFTGEIIVDLIPHIYDTNRVVRILKEDGQDDMVEINKPEPPGLQMVKDQQMLAAIKKDLNDITVGKYDIQVTTGPGFQTKRVEAANTTQSLLQGNPQLMQVAGDLFVKSLDIPYAQEIAKRLERTIPPAIREDGPPPPPPPPPPAEIAKLVTAQANAALAQAQTEGQNIKNIADSVQVMQAIQAMHADLRAIQAWASQVGHVPPIPGQQVPQPPIPAPSTGLAAPLGGSPGPSVSPTPGGAPMVELEPLPQSPIA